MTRSTFKLDFVDPKLWKKVLQAQKDGSNKQIKTWSRASVIIPAFVGRTFLVHNGKGHVPVHAQDAMIGHRLGEFAPTRTFKGHSGDKKVKK